MVTRKTVRQLRKTQAFPYKIEKYITISALSPRLKELLFHSRNFINLFFCQDFSILVDGP